MLKNIQMPKTNHCQAARGGNCYNLNLGYQLKLFFTCKMLFLYRSRFLRILFFQNGYGYSFCQQKYWLRLILVNICFGYNYHKSSEKKFVNGYNNYYINVDAVHS